MKDELKIVVPKGIKKDTPWLGGDDGACEELINLRFEDGAWKGVGNKKPLEAVIRSSKTYLKVFKIPCLPEDHYACFTATELVLVKAKAVGNSDEQVLYTCQDGETPHDLTWLNNIIVFYTTRGSRYMIYRPGKPLEQMIQLLDKLQMPRLAVTESTLPREVKFDGEATPTMTTEINENYFKYLQGEIAKPYDEARRDGYFFGNVSLMFAYKLFDGSLIMHTGPYAWNVSKRDGNHRITRIYAQAGSGAWNIKAILNHPVVYYQYTDAKKQALQAYKDAGLVRSLCIYMTPERSGHDFRNLEFTRWTAGSTEDVTQPEGLLRYYDPPYNAEIVKNLANEVNYYLVKEIPVEDVLKDEGYPFKEVHIKLENGLLKDIETAEVMGIDNFTHHDMIPSKRFIYNSRVHLGDIKVLAGQMHDPFIHSFNDDIPRWWTPRVYLDGEFTHADSYLDGMAPVLDKATLLGTLKIYLRASIESGGIVRQVEKEVSGDDITIFNDAATSKHYLAIRPMASYPDNRATSWELVCSNATVDSVQRRMTGVFSMRPSTFHNFAARNFDSERIAELDLMLPTLVELPLNAEAYSALTEITTVNTLEWQETNRLQVSEVNNPLFYPARQSYRVGNPENRVLALIVAQETMTEMQFGQFPLYAFTSEGIYALEYQGGEVLYTRIVQFLNDIIVENATPLSISDGAIVYQERSGIKILLGRQSKDIGRPVFVVEPNALHAHELIVANTTTDEVSNLYTVLDSAGDSLAMQQYLLGSNIGFDPFRMEVWFSRKPDTDSWLAGGKYSLVYQVKTGSWYKRTEVFKDYIRDAGGDLAMTVKVDGETRTIIMHELAEELFPDESALDKPWFFMLTRPMLFGRVVTKRLRDIVMRCTGVNRDMDVVDDAIIVKIINMGTLYNSYVIKNNRRLTSSDAWRVPSKADFETLGAYLGGLDIAGGKLKELSAKAWNAPNTGATNEVKFNSKGAGWRLNDRNTDVFEKLMELTAYWTTTVETGCAWPVHAKLFYNSAVLQLINTLDDVNSGENTGMSIRLVTNATAEEQKLVDGTVCATYTGNDGQQYPAIKIGTQVWLKYNLNETRYRDNLQDWIKGMLYNYAAGTDPRSISSSDTWQVPSKTDLLTLKTLCTAKSAANPGGVLKSVGLDYWLTPNTGATDLVKFNARGVGQRQDNGYYSAAKAYFTMMSRTRTDASYTVRLDLTYNNGAFFISDYTLPNLGMIIRLVRTATTEEQSLADGTYLANYTGNDGKSYKTVKIGTQVWMAENLRETLYRKGNNPLAPSTFGALYNAYAIVQTPQKITSSDNWIVPNEADAIALMENVQAGATLMENTAGLLLRHDSTEYWLENLDSPPTNASGFSAVGGGIRWDMASGDGEFSRFKEAAFYMLSSTPDSTNQDSIVLFYNMDFFGLSLNDRGQGMSVRLARRNSPLADGQLGTYTGNNGKVYRTKCFGTTEWMIENLDETKYRDEGVNTNVCAGYFYSQSTATDARNIASKGWHVPNINEANMMVSFIGGPTKGHDLKEMGSGFWPMAYGTNLHKFNLRAFGYRRGKNREVETEKAYFLINESRPDVNGLYYAVMVNDAGAIQVNGQVTWGCSLPLRLVKDTTTLNHGQQGIYVGNDGKRYRTICIGSQEWLADNLCETKWRDGTPIANYLNGDVYHTCLSFYFDSNLTEDITFYTFSVKYMFDGVLKTINFTPYDTNPDIVIASYAEQHEVSIIDVKVAGSEGALAEIYWNDTSSYRPIADGNEQTFYPLANFFEALNGQAFFVSGQDIPLVESDNNWGWYGTINAPAMCYMNNLPIITPDPTRKDPIPYVGEGLAWRHLKTGARCYFDTWVDSEKDENIIPLKQTKEEWDTTSENFVLVDYYGKRCYYGGDESLAFTTGGAVTGSLKSKSALFILGSMDGAKWYRVAWVKNSRSWYNDFKLKQPIGDYRYYVLAYAGRVEDAEIRQADITYFDTFNKKLR